MFIRVKYGDDETLLCNSSCAVVNLLSNIKSRSGLQAQNDVVVDLADETGLVQELDLHPYDCAAKHLAVPGTYVLVRKQPTASGLDVEDETAETTHDYVPLLNNYQQILPSYRVQRTAAGTGEAARRKPGKTLNPAAAAKPSVRSKQGKDRVPSRKR